MTEFKDYKMYVEDKDWYNYYSNYQKKYKTNPRESDKKLTRLLMK